MKKIVYPIALVCLCYSGSIFTISKLQKNSLLNYAWSKYSQRGEEGILEEILKKLHITKGFFVEFGASDGITFSNTRFLIERNWKGVYIESDKDLFVKLTKNYKDVSNIICINELISWNSRKGKTFDSVADKYFPKQEIDFLSIDIDGADYLILENLKRKPKILCVEGGFSWNPLLATRVPDHVAFQNLQQPLAIIIKIAKRQGYEPVCFTQNTFFIRKDLYKRFLNIKNDPVTLWLDAWYYWGKKYNDERINLINFRKTNPLITFYDKNVISLNLFLKYVKAR